MTTAAARWPSLLAVATPSRPEPNRTVLTWLRPKQRAKIVRVNQEGEAGEQLMELGLVAGTEVEVLSRSSLGRGHLQLSLRGYRLMLRHDDADSIEVVALSA